MRVKVSSHGVTVPKHMLGGADEVEIRDENGRVVVEPVRGAEQEGSDPILGLGRNPVACGAPDASVRHDQYLYDE